MILRTMACLLVVIIFPGILASCCNTDDSEPAGAISFAEGGQLKMFYDNRMHSQAVEYDGKSWTLNADYAPLEGYRYQNIKAISSQQGYAEVLQDVFLFYGWEQSGEPGSGVAFLMDKRPVSKK